jgi:hypothetical protein
MPQLPQHRADRIPVDGVRRQVGPAAGGGGEAEGGQRLFSFEWTKNQTLVHELGHQKQQEQGIDVNQQNNSKALVEYHKIVCNENVLTHTEDQEAKPRVSYSQRGEGTFSSGTKKRMAAADWPYQADTWDLLLRHVDTLANDNEKRLPREIGSVLDSEENPERYRQ